MLNEDGRPPDADQTPAEVQAWQQRMALFATRLQNLGIISPRWDPPGYTDTTMFDEYVKEVRWHGDQNLIAELAELAETGPTRPGWREKGSWIVERVQTGTLEAVPFAAVWFVNWLRKHRRAEQAHSAEVSHVPLTDEDAEQFARAFAEAERGGPTPEDTLLVWSYSRDRQSGAEPYTTWLFAFVTPDKRYDVRIEQRVGENLPRLIGWQSEPSPLLRFEWLRDHPAPEDKHGDG